MRLNIIIYVIVMIAFTLAGEYKKIPPEYWVLIGIVIGTWGIADEIRELKKAVEKTRYRLTRR